MIIVKVVPEDELPNCQVKDRGKIFVVQGDQCETVHFNIDFH